MKSGWKSISVFSRTASLKWRGKESGEDLQALTAQVRKFVVKSFISDQTGSGQRGVFLGETILDVACRESSEVVYFIFWFK